MEAFSVKSARPHSVGNVKSPVCVRVKRHQAVHLELEGKSIAVGHPKHLEAHKATHSDRGKAKRRKGNAPPDVPPPVQSKTDQSSSGTTYPAT
jgi:hypothetical protein